MKTNAQAKKEWLMGKGIGNNLTPVDQQETVYYRSQATSTGGKRNAKLQYLRRLITNHGGTPSGIYESDLLKQAVAILGLSPRKTVQGNWRLIYDINA